MALSSLSLKLRMARCPGERHHVPDVLHPRQVHDESLEAETEAGMGAGTPAAGIQVPPEAGRVDSRFGHPRFKKVKPLLPLAPADDLPYLGNQKVHGRHGPPVVVLPHVERLDVLWVIYDEYWS